MNIKTKNNKIKISQNSGFSLVEVILAIAVFVTMTTAIIYASIDAYESHRQGEERIYATMLAEEGLEASRNIRDSGWDNLTSGNHGLTQTENAWNFISESDIDESNRYTRQINISALDNDRKLITSTVSWEFKPGRTDSIILTSYLFNTTKNTPTAPNWDDPKIFGSTANGNNLAPNDVFVSGDYAYVVTNNASSGNEFFIYNISDVNSPQLINSYNVGSTVNAVFVVGNYAYLATSSNTMEIVVLKINNPQNITQVSTVNAPNNADATDIFVLDRYVYFTTTNNSSNREFYIYDAINPESMPSSYTGRTEIGVNALTLSVSGNFAYIGTSSSSAELRAINITNKSNPTLVGSYNYSGSALISDIFSSGTNIYVTTANSGSYPECFIISANISNPNSVSFSLSGSYDVGSAVNGIFADIANNQIFLATQDNKREFLELDISDIAHIKEKAKIDLHNQATAITFNGSYVFEVTLDNSQGLVIIGPQ